MGFNLKAGYFKNELPAYLVWHNINCPKCLPAVKLHTLAKSVDFQCNIVLARNWHGNLMIF